MDQCVSALVRTARTPGGKRRSPGQYPAAVGFVRSCGSSESTESACYTPLESPVLRDMRSRTPQFAIGFKPLLARRVAEHVLVDLRPVCPERRPVIVPKALLEAQCSADVRHHKAQFAVGF
jgi:hypothetical protein